MQLARGQLELQFKTGSTRGQTGSKRGATVVPVDKRPTINKGDQNPQSQQDGFERPKHTGKAYPRTLGGVLDGLKTLFLSPLHPPPRQPFQPTPSHSPGSLHLQRRSNIAFCCKVLAPRPQAPGSLGAGERSPRSFTPGSGGQTQGERSPASPLSGPCMVLMARSGVKEASFTPGSGHQTQDDFPDS